jgi:hypothetical protein
VDQLSDALRQAVADPPPSTIDIDRLIVGEQHRARRQRWLAAAAATTLLVTAAVATPSMLTGGPMHGAGGGARCPGVSSDPTAFPLPGNGPAPSESCEAAMERLKAAVLDAVSRVLPGAEVRFVTEGSGPVVAGSGGEYLATLEISDASGTSVLSLRWSTFGPAGPAGARAAACGGTGGGSSPPLVPASGTAAGCYGLQVLPDGSAMLTVGFEPDPPNIVLAYHKVYLYRTDGTFIELHSQNYRMPSEAYLRSLTASPLGHPEGMLVPLRPAPLSYGQLVELGETPGLTLFPR